MFYMDQYQSFLFCWGKLTYVQHFDAEFVATSMQFYQWIFNWERSSSNTSGNTLTWNKYLISKFVVNWFSISFACNPIDVYVLACSYMRAYLTVSMCVFAFPSTLMDHSFIMFNSLVWFRLPDQNSMICIRILIRITLVSLKGNEWNSLLNTNYKQCVDKSWKNFLNKFVHMKNAAHKIYFIFIEFHKTFRRNSKLKHYPKQTLRIRRNRIWVQSENKCKTITSNFN